MTHLGESGGSNRALVGKLEGKRQIGRPWQRWADNIRMDLQEITWDWINLSQNVGSEELL